MHRRIVGAWASSILVLGLLSASIASAENYRSAFGFDITVPDVWLVLTQDEVKKNAELFQESEGDPTLSSIQPEMRRQVFDRIAAGDVEIFYRREGASAHFVDNINVMEQPAQLPKSKAQLQQLCGILPGEFSRIFGRPIAMDECTMRKVAGGGALYLQFDGAIEGTSTFQYQLQRTKTTTIVITATATTENVPRMMSEFESMVSSIRLRRTPTNR